MLFSIDYIGKAIIKVSSILPIEIPNYKYYRAFILCLNFYQCSSLYLEIFIICNLKISLIDEILNVRKSVTKQ